MNDIRKNGQVNQPNVTNVPDNNGWPEPLTDPSNPYARKVTVGRNGESMAGDIKTSQQKAGEHHKAEGSQGATPSQPEGYLTSERTSSPFATTGRVSDPAGNNDPKATMPPYSEDAIGRANSDPTVTTQQHDKAHKLPEGR